MSNYRTWHQERNHAKQSEEQTVKMHWEVQLLH